MDVSSMSQMSTMFSGITSQAQFQQLQTDAFSNADTDGSGGLSIDEASETEFGSKINDNFSDIDTDGDGELSQDEMTEFMQSKMDEMMSSMRMTGGADSASMFDALLQALEGGEEEETGTSSSDASNTASAIDAYEELAAVA